MRYPYPQSLPDNPSETHLLSLPVWDLDDIDLIKLWDTFTLAPTSSRELHFLLDEILRRSSLSINSTLMSTEALTLSLAYLLNTRRGGFYISPPHGAQIASRSKTGILKARKYYRLLEFNHILSGDKSYGFVRFSEPILVTREQAYSMEPQHLVSREDIDKWWKDKDYLYFYPLRDLVAFQDPIPTPPLDGSQVYVEDVELLLPPPFEVSKSSSSPLLSADPERHLIYGILAESLSEDPEGDSFASIDVLRDAVHEFMRESRAVESRMAGIDHPNVANPRLNVVEVFIPTDDITFHGHLVKAGSCIVGIESFDPTVWEQIQTGEIKGFSFYATGSGEYLD